MPTIRASSFAGFTALYEEGKDDEQGGGAVARCRILPRERVSISPGVHPEQHFTQPPARYTEATLVRAMEEKGVGRPSTYAGIISTIQDRDYVIKKEKRLWPTPLGEVVTGLMKERFQDIIDVAFTAHMEQQLDQVEEGKLPWKQVLADFYAGFHKDMEEAERSPQGHPPSRCPRRRPRRSASCAAGRWSSSTAALAASWHARASRSARTPSPSWSICRGAAPKCGAGMLKRKSKRGFAYYSCERGAECGFMTWDVPTEFDCPSCGQTMFKKSGRGANKPFCINEACPNFLPEDQRGYRRKPAASVEAAEAEAAAEETKEAEAAAPEKKPAKKPAAKKTAVKKTAAAKAPRKKAEAKTE